MSSFWETYKISPITLAKLGPWVDGIVGTDGAYQDLYEAVNTGGWTRIILASGAIISADLTISSTGTFIWSPYTSRGLTLGGYKITVTATEVHLAGFRLNGSGANIEVQAANFLGERLAIESGAGNGITMKTAAGNDHRIEDCFIGGNGGDGIHIESGCKYVLIRGCHLYNNTLYGVDDSASGYSLVDDCRLTLNGSGNVNSGTYTVVGDVQTH